MKPSRSTFLAFLLSMLKRFRWPVKIILLVIVIFWLFWRLGDVPPLAYWWDEAWPMSVARNWVELGYYGQLLDGVPQTSGLSASFVVIMPVAWSFRILGVGVWQARFVIALFTLAALAALYLLARFLYHPKIAWGTLLVVLVMSPPLLTNPIYVGRQVFSELPMLFFLLAGYLFFYLSFRHVAWTIPMVIVWGICLITKYQPLPFWAISLLVVLGITIFHRQWRAVLILIIGLPGSWVFSKLLADGFTRFIAPQTFLEHPLKGLTQISAFTFDPFSRQSALLMILFAGGHIVIAIGYRIWVFWRRFRMSIHLAPKELTSLALLVFCISWLFWYLFLSIGWARYLLPVMFVGSLFVSVLFHELTEEFDPVYIVKTAGYAIRHLRFNWRSLGVLWFILCLVYNVDLTYTQWHQAFTAPPDGASQVAEYLNTQTAPNALIETYESGIVFLLKRPYHYPPDEVSVKILYLRTDTNTKLDYDPLPADPDYLVIGRLAREVKLYEPTLTTGQFRLVEKIGLYDIYQRIR